MESVAPPGSRSELHGRAARYRLLRTFPRSGVAHSGILMIWKVRCSHAQTNSRNRQRGVLRVSSGHGCGLDPVVVNALAGARAAAVLDVHAGARSGAARRWTDHAGWSVRAFRSRGA